MVTGGAGFIGHHVVEHLLRTTDHEVIVMDRLDCAGNLNRLVEIKDWDEHKKRVRWMWHDLKAPVSDQLAAQVGRVDVVLHLAASTHVDRSITDPAEFVYDNVVGTLNILEYVRKHLHYREYSNFERFLYFSTDEVFGPAPPGVYYEEWSRYRSANPYSASKAGGEELCVAYENTYKIPILITHCMNVFGERQSPEKFIPSTISKVYKGEKVIVHADRSRTKPGSRFYIHARNVADALLFVLARGVPGEKYNIVGEKEIDNLQLAQLIAKCVEKPLDYELVDFHSSRPGHDLRYALDGHRMASLGWKVPVAFEEGLARVVSWSLDNTRWLL